MPDLELPLDRPIDLVATLRPLVRGQGDRSIRLRPGAAWWTVRVAGGPATVVIRTTGDRLRADTFGPGAVEALERVPGLVGALPGAASPADLPAGVHRLVDSLARTRPGLRISRSRAVLDALVPAILEQKVTGEEARRAWQGLVRALGEDAPGEAGAGLRLAPPPGRLAELPYHAYRPFGIERRRAELIRAVATRADALEALAERSPAEASAALQAIPGIGPWTAAEVAVRAFGDADAVSVGDFHLPNLVAWALAGEPRADDARMLELLEPYRGRRAIVLRLLESAGRHAPRHGPRLAPRAIGGI
ncbi:MAG: DNA-3-methyladenine glycosylase family protein [Candidatus Limnocylindria bacterium]